MSYPGGKEGSGVYQRIINLLPPHRVYIEPFAGGAAVFRHKRPAEVEWLIDKDAEAIAALDSLATAERPGVQLRVGCGIDFLEVFPFTGGEVVYIDPPYMRETLLSGRTRYKFDLDDEEHARLLNAAWVASAAGALVLISGYASPLYERELESWRSIEYQTMTRGGTLADEVLWLSFQPPAVLHDYAHVGSDYRDRERIAKRRRRWLANFKRMKPHEQGAILHDLREYFIGKYGGTGE